MTTKSGNQHSLLVTIGIGVFVLAYVFAVFLPTRRAIADLGRQLQAKRQYVMLTQQQFATFGQMQEELEAAQLQARNWRNTAPRGADLAGFLRSLSEISSQTGATIQRITPEQPTQLETLRRHPVRVVVEGNFHQVFAFLCRLEALPLTAWNTRLHLHRESENSETLQCELSLAVFTDNRDSSD